MGPDSPTSTKAFQFSEPSSLSDASPTKTPGALPDSEAVRDTNRPGVASKKLKPVYTLPSDSTLIGSIAMTALVGRVPVDGVVNDPTVQGI